MNKKTCRKMSNNLRNSHEFLGGVNHLPKNLGTKKKGSIMLNV